MEMRNRRMQVFRDTLQLCEREEELLDGIVASRTHTVVWEKLHEMNNDMLEERFFKEKKDSVLCRVECLEKEVLEFVCYLKKRNPVCRVGVLCVPNTTYIGGNVLRGGLGLEEMLCRCTTLYPCVNQQHIRKAYYVPQDSGMGEGCDAQCIYVPNVVGVRMDENSCDRLQCQDRFSFDVMQYVSTNQGQCNLDTVLQMAVAQGLEKMVTCVYPMNHFKSFE